MKKLLFILSLFFLITSCDKTPIITLSVDKSEIAADGKESATFKVICIDKHNNEEDVTNECLIFFSDSKLELGATAFSTTEPNTYSFYATYEDAVSNDVTVTAIEVEAEPEDPEDPQDPQDPEESPIVLSASKTSILNDGKDNIIFTVMQDSLEITTETKIYVGDTKLKLNVFTSTEVGTYIAYAMKGEVKSNEITITVEEEKPETPENPEEKPIVLSASKTKITANGTDAVTFTVKQEDNDVTSETEIYVNDNKINGNTFTTTTAGTYKAYAKKGELKSNEISITAEAVAEPEKPIELIASTTNITANGSDAVTFTVMQENNDVTSQAEIFVNGGKLNGNKFTTYTSGTYTAYAQKNEAKSNEITITVSPVPDMGKTIVFADGVSISSGWYDVNKLSKNGGDINMCWAASASNIIEWWQDRYMAAGNTLPSGAVTGEGQKSYDGIGAYNLALMELYRDLWKDNDKKGAYTDQAVIWYFEGRNVQKYASEGSCAQPNAAGGYYSSVWNEILPKVYHEYKSDVFPNEFYDLISKEYNSYTSWGNGSGVTGTEQLKKFSDLVVEFIDRGVASLAITVNKSGGLLHATTLWGYEIDNATGMLTKIWITDSDDMHQSGNGDPTIQLLREYSISHDSSSLGKIKLSGEPYGACWALSLYPVSGYNSAK